MLHSLKKESLRGPKDHRVCGLYQLWAGIYFESPKLNRYKGDRASLFTQELLNLGVGAIFGVIVYHGNIQRLVVSSPDDCCVESLAVVANFVVVKRTSETCHGTGCGATAKRYPFSRIACAGFLPRAAKLNDRSVLQLTLGLCAHPQPVVLAGEGVLARYSESLQRDLSGLLYCLVAFSHYVAWDILGSE